MPPEGGGTFKVMLRLYTYIIEEHLDIKLSQ